MIISLFLLHIQFQYLGQLYLYVPILKIVNMPPKLDKTKTNDIQLLFHYFKREKIKSRGRIKSDSELQNCVSKALNVSISSVKRILVKNEQLDREKKSRKKKLDAFHMEMIRRIVHGFYAECVSLLSFL